MPRMRWRPGLCPRPCWGSSRHPPDSPLAKYKDILSERREHSTDFMHGSCHAE